LVAREHQRLLDSARADQLVSSFALALAVDGMDDLADESIGAFRRAIWTWAGS
jgi:hypothetical protein